MKKIMLASLVVFLLSGCTADNNQPKYAPNQELRIKLFQECLKLIPEGPKYAKYNDWSEVIEQCDKISRYQSMKCIKNCN